jgi:RND family efflux transporter MFP subunit
LEVVLRGPRDEDVQQAQAAIDQAQQQLDKARLPYTNNQLQQQEQAVAQAGAQLQKVLKPYTDQDFAAAQAAVDQAQAATAQANLALSDTVVTAPVDGVVADRLVSPGALVSPQTAIMVLVPLSIELVVNVEESDLPSVAAGQSVELQVPAFPTQTFSGTVASISPTIDSKTRTARVHIQPDDVANQLRSGMFANLSIVTSEKQDALVVPRQAVLGGTTPTVIAIDSEGVAHRQPVRIGIQGDQLTEVLSGIDEGQLVATSGLSSLSDGEMVAPQVEAPVAMSP